MASGSSSLWSLVQHFKKPLTLACNEHLLLDLVKLFEEQPSERLRTIIEWIEENGNEQLDELMTSRILDRNGYFKALKLNKFLICERTMPEKSFKEIRFLYSK